MSNQPIFLNIIWHQHQPWYIGPDSNTAWMPWVRMHGVKDYYDIAWLSKRFEGWKQTINLVPSLLEQLDGYCSESFSDTSLELSRIPASELKRDDKRQILERFYDAHAPRMIDPYPRYSELNQKRSGPVEDAIDRFSSQDYLDLQVWFNLAWLDPLWLENPDEVAASLIQKGSGFTEDEKQALLSLHLKILRKIVPIHREMAEQGSLELTTTPYFHPILPLLCDSEIARVSNPYDPVPQPGFQAPDDAKRHIQAGLACFESHFGFRPRGMWPSEGSVSDQACALMAAEGIRFFSTDEAVLFRSTPTQGGSLDRRDLFRLHKLATPQGDLECVFRDHGLSDFIGFVAQTMDGKEAAKTLIGHLHAIGSDWNGAAPPLVNIILDGENCWEYYPRDGHDFLHFFIEGVLNDSRIIPTTVPEYSDSHPTEPTLQSIFPGSWINHNFRIWIGHEEDNLAWSLLRDARTLLVERENNLDESKRTAAWRQLDICEGSDWFWWYGDENQSSLDFIFDQLFRSHLAHLYELLGEEPPEELRRPIKQTHHIVAGRGGLLRRTPDLGDTGYYQWSGALFSPASSGGAMHQADSMDADAWLARHDSRLCVKLEFGTAAALKKATDISLEIYRPENASLSLRSGHEAIVDMKESDNHLLAIVDLSKFDIDDASEIAFSFAVRVEDGLEAKIPPGGEFILQGATDRNDSLLWHV